LGYTFGDDHEKRAGVGGLRAGAAGRGRVRVVRKGTAAATAQLVRRPLRGEVLE
jgi:hypothetical protein